MEVGWGNGEQVGMCCVGFTGLHGEMTDKSEGRYEFGIFQHMMGLVPQDWVRSIGCEYGSSRGEVQRWMSGPSSTQRSAEGLSQVGGKSRADGALGAKG